MLAEILLFTLMGIIAGIFTGLAPGIHINLVGAFLISLSASALSGLNPIYLVVLISAMAITHTFIDFIPSIFLGCPDADTELSILPGHEMLKRGEGYQAVMNTAYGCLAAIFILIFLTIPLSVSISKVYPYISKIIPYILIFICFIMVLSEKKKFYAFLVLSLTGILGLCVLNLNLKEPLLPLLSGLFGSSTIIMSINQKTKIPFQNKNFEKPKIKKLIRPVSGALIASPLCGFLPGLGGGQAAVVGNQIAKTNQKDFLVLLGAVNILVMGMSFISLYSISKTRTGAAAAIRSLVNPVSFKILILIISVCAISGIISFFITKKLSLKFIKVFEKINYTKISYFIIVFLGIIILLISGILGLAVFAVSTLTGIYCISLNVKRTQMMGCLLIPTIILYLF